MGAFSIVRAGVVVFKCFPADQWATVVAQLRVLVLRVVWLLGLCAADEVAPCMCSGGQPDRRAKASLADACMAIRRRSVGRTQMLQIPALACTCGNCVSEWGRLAINRVRLGVSYRRAKCAVVLLRSLVERLGSRGRDCHASVLCRAGLSSCAYTGLDRKTGKVVGWADLFSLRVPFSIISVRRSSCSL